MPYFQVQTNIDEWPFDFTDFFPSSDTIASTVVLCSPAGLVELSAKSSTSGLQRKIVIDAASATANTSYVLGCQCTSAAGLRHTLYKTIRVIADETGATAITGSTGYNAIYSATLSQSGTSAPSVTVINYNTLSAAPVWTRTAEGTYVATLAGAFIENKTRVSCELVPLLVGSESSAAGKRLTDNTVGVYVRDYADNLTDGFSILYVSISTYT